VTKRNVTGFKKSTRVDLQKPLILSGFFMLFKKRKTLVLSSKNDEDGKMVLPTMSFNAMM
jgi:hypothetical protein